MGTDRDFLGQLGPELLAVLPRLDERSRRLMLGMAARAAGDGGTAAVAALARVAPQTVAKGAAELESGQDPGPGRIRRPGGGRRLLTDSDPGLLAALEALIKDAMRGDPESPLVWTTRSAQHLAGELTVGGHPCSDSTVLRVMRRAGYTQQSNSRAQEGRQHPERDAQFRYIAAMSREFTGAGQPVISVDAKKKEQVGNYGQAGREWRPKGDPVQVRSHDFADKDGRHAVPYGIWDEQARAGFVNVGTDGNTAALATESVRRWWNLVGKDAYPHATRLLVTADSGSSNGYKNRAWKAGLAELAAATGLEITVCHFPPGTSKWNKIEHRLFCQISLAWRGRPLTSYDVIINTIGAVRTATGLTATAVLDENAYPTGTQISDKQMKDIEDRCLTRHPWHGEWNYTLHAIPRTAPEPGPPPPAPAPRLCSQHQLNHPALTGMDPADLTALAAAVQIPFRASREQHLHRKRGRPRINAQGAGGTRRIDITDHLLATCLRQHLNLPRTVIAALLGVKPNTISKATSLTARLLAAVPTAPQPASPPPGIRLRTLDDLRNYAAAHGIAITSPPATDTSPTATLTTPTHRDTTLF